MEINKATELMFTLLPPEMQKILTPLTPEKRVKFLMRQRLASNKEVIKIEAIYKDNPEFIKDILQLHFFGTALYYIHRMNDFPKLQISSKLKIALFMVEDATSYSIENGEYNFVLKKNILGTPSKVYFPILFNALINTCYNAADIEDMYTKLYNSRNPLLIKLAEQFKNKDINISIELFDFAKRKECVTNKNWSLSEIESGDWNYTLLALNKDVWESAFDITYLSKLFQEEKK